MRSLSIATPTGCVHYHPNRWRDRLHSQQRSRQRSGADHSEVLVDPQLKHRGKKAKPSRFFNFPINRLHNYQIFHSHHHPLELALTSPTKELLWVSN
jgi:hypothetical protein